MNQLDQPDKPVQLDRPVRIGFIGCGAHASNSIYPTFRLGVTRRTALGDAVGELVACCDLDETRARQNARTFGFERWYTDHRRMLDSERLDCVFVVMHPRLQAGLALECLEAGLPVFVEKPATVTLEDAYAIRAACQRSGKFLMIGFMKRFSAPYLQALAFTRRPEFGVPSVFESRFTYGRYPVQAYRFLNGFATHHLDLPRYFMGDVQSVSAERVSRGEGLDGYAITLRFANGGVGLVNVSCLEGEHNNWSERVAVTGVGGRVFVENWRRVIGFLPEEQGEGQTYYWEPEDIRPADDQNSLAIHGFVGELRDFAQSVREGRPPACTIEDGLAALRLERAVELSVERGARVTL